MKWSVKQIEDLPLIAKEFVNKASGHRVFAFEGEMGAGKTTFIKHVLAELGVSDWEGSPTYSIVNEYIGSNGEKLFHFDMYRLNDETEALDIGFDEIVNGGGISFIEWAENVSNLLPLDTKWIRITKNEEIREIILEL